MVNEYSADIPKGLNVPKQVRLDSITSIQNENTLKNLGPGNNLAFKYYDGLKVYCKDEKTEYIWREVVGVETGLLDVHFTYPIYPPVDGIDYSGKSYNFFQNSETKINQGTNITITGNGTNATPYIINSNQDNTVKQIIINEATLPLNYSVADVRSALLALPPEDRTVLDTNSKVNVIVKFLAS